MSSCTDMEVAGALPGQLAFLLEADASHQKDWSGLLIIQRLAEKLVSAPLNRWAKHTPPSEALNHTEDSIKHLPRPTQANKIQLGDWSDACWRHMHAAHKAATAQHRRWSIRKARRIIGDGHLAPF